VIVDVHTHLFPRPYIELLERRSAPPRIVGVPGRERLLLWEREAAPGGSGGRLMSEDFWEIEEKVAYMDHAGIDRSVVSLANPWLDPFGPEEARGAAAVVNEELAGLEGRTGGRAVGLGALPQHDVAEAVAVVREIASTPTLHGVANGRRLCGRWLDDPGLEPLWDAFESTGLPLLIHPNYSFPVPDLAGFGMVPTIALGFPFETTAAVARLALGGVLHRHPGLRVVAAHGGGTLPFLAGRLDAAWRVDPAARERCPVPPSELLARIHLDALVYAPGPLRLIVDAVGADRVMFGTDHPFDVADPERNLSAIAAALSEEERRGVLSRSASALFGLPNAG
jgi:aminocarboxymuconate-semialdehyde decarboxylase